MNILEKIVANKRKEVADNKSLYPAKLLEKSVCFEVEPVSLKKYLLRPDASGVIAEFKRRSPSKGIINQYASVERITIGYMQAGASALSVLTDAAFFGGRNEDLITARKFNYCPILRKDFTLDEYQVTEAKSIGADAILLIATILQPKEIQALAQYAKSLGMEVVLEVHTKDELENNLHADVDIIGVNNRNLNDFTVDMQTSLSLGKLIPKEFLKISESGISSEKTMRDLKAEGFNGFLIGETFMKSSRPDKACKELIQKLNATRVLS